MSSEEAAQKLSPEDVLLGRLALHYKILSPEKLNWAMRAQQQQGGSQKLTDILLRHQLITPTQLQQLRKVQLAMHEKQRAAHKPASAPQPGQSVATRPIISPTAAQPKSTGAAASSNARPVKVESQGAQNKQMGNSVLAGHDGTMTTHRGTGFMMQILRDAHAQGASDVHVHGGAPVRFRVGGALLEQDSTPLSATHSQALVRELLSDAQWASVQERGQLDFAYALPGVARFRGNAYRQQRGCDMVLRVIPESPPTLEALGLPENLRSVLSHHQGMVLLTGPAGCGKSSTMAAMINIINESRSDHIITVEEPIEYVHPSKSCIVNQRQVGQHTESFARALRAALREDPDVIAIGELRDLETISLALTAAETGHFVLGTLHTNNTIRTISRILGVFPPDQQAQIRMMVSESLKAVISQRLLPRADGAGLVAALEILHVNKATANLIRDNKTFQIRSVLQTGATHGMCLLDSSLAELVRTGAISNEEALRHAEDKKRFATQG